MIKYSNIVSRYFKYVHFVQITKQTCRYIANKLCWFFFPGGNPLLRSKRWPAMTSGVLPFFSWSLVVPVSDFGTTMLLGSSTHPSLLRSLHPSVETLFEMCTLVSVRVRISRYIDQV